VKCKNKIRPAFPRKNPMRRAALTFDAPADVKQCGQNLAGFA
jgi:hypothetical protein